MNFARYKKTIEHGDTVVLYLGFNSMMAIQVNRGKTHQTKYGALRHDHMIGKEYGSKVKCSRGWLHVLYPTPELWTMTLPHRTQIVYSTDISMITLQLELKPGTVVVESGTGSGSLSHAILRSVAPTGHLHTFDFHEKRAAQACAEFKEHGFEDVVTVRHRDVCSEGFDLEGVADAVFLDLPSPWEALPHAKRAMKKSGGRICSFSPCIEQVQRACGKLSELGFCDITTSEVLLQDYHMYNITMPVEDSWEGYPQDMPSTTAFKLKDEPPIGAFEQAASITDANGNEDTDRDMGHKRHHGHKHKANKKQRTDAVASKAKKQMSFKFKTAIPKGSAHGHTGFLTFATLYPKYDARLCADNPEEQKGAQNEGSNEQTSDITTQQDMDIKTEKDLESKTENDMADQS